MRIRFVVPSIVVPTKPLMQTRHFTVHVADPPDVWERFDDLVDRFWADGKNDDASPAMSEEHMTIGFDRESGSLEEAIRSAVAAVRSIGLEVDRVELDRDDLARCGMIAAAEPTVEPVAA